MGSGRATATGRLSLPSRMLVAVALAAALATWMPGAAGAATPPAISGTVSDSTTMAGSLAVAVSGHFAYTTAYWSGRLVAVDISNPAHPVIAGASAYSSSLQNASTVNIVGGYAYVVSKNRNASTTNNDDGTGNSLTILNIAANPRQPAIVGTLHDPTNLFGAYGVAGDGSYVYVAAQGVLRGQPAAPDTSTGAFNVIDARNPAAPALLSTLRNSALPAPWTGTNALEHISAVALSGHFAYVTAAYSDRLTVIDVSNPLSPTIVASLQDTNALHFPVDVAVSRNYAYVVGQGSSHPTLSVVDISHPDSPRVVGSLATSSLTGAYRIRVRGQFAYVASITASTLSVIDLSHPNLPHLDAELYDHLVHLHSVAGVDVDPTGRYAVMSSPSLSTQSSTAYPPYPGQPGGPTITGTITTVKLDPVRLKVSIIATSGVHSSASRTSAIFHVAASDAVAAFQCRLDRGAFSPCTGATHQIYNSLRAGRHVFTVRAVDPAGDVSTAQRTWVVGPSAAKVKASLRRQLVPRGKAGGLHAVLARGGYSFAFRAIGAGKASVSWYFLPPGARIVLPGSKHHHQHHPSPVLVATGHVTFTRAGTRRLTIKLTSAGRQLLHGPISLVAEGSFTPSAEQAVILLAPFRLH